MIDYVVLFAVAAGVHALPDFFAAVFVVPILPPLASLLSLALLPSPPL